MSDPEASQEAKIIELCREMINTIRNEIGVERYSHEFKQAASELKQIHGHDTLVRCRLYHLLIGSSGYKKEILVDFGFDPNTTFFDFEGTKSIQRLILCLFKKLVLGWE